jgi:dihydroxyacetone kinase
VTAEASEESIAAAEVARKAVDAIYATVEENKDYLGQIDAIAGDGDHGIGMSRGSKAAAEAANGTRGGVETVLAAAGHAFGDKAGGTSGILWGLLLEGVGKGLGNTEAVTSKRLADAVQSSATNLQGFSKAQLGDKTMLDALFPFVDTLVGQIDSGASISKRGGRPRMCAGPQLRQRHRLFPRSVGPGRWQSAALAHQIRAPSHSA